MRDIVIYFAGGTMTGVFGAGVASAFSKEDLYPRIKAVYGASAGSMTMAYFIAKQAKVGSSIYWENLNHNFLVSGIEFFLGIWQRFEDRFLRKLRPREFKEALNLKYLFNDIVKKDKKLDTEAIINQEIPSYVKLLDLDNLKIEYVDIRRPDILSVLKAGVNVLPYMYRIRKTDGKRLIDAAGIEVIGIDYLLEKYPNDKIVVVVNRDIKTKLQYRIKSGLEGVFMRWRFNNRKIYKLYRSAEDNFQSDIKKIKRADNVYLLSLPPDISLKTITTSRKTLLKAYDAGMDAGYKFIEKLYENKNWLSQ